MTIGPLQIVLIELADESLTLPVSKELKAVREKGIIRLVDMLYIHRDEDGTIYTKEISDLTKTEKAEYGAVLRGLVGLETARRQEGDVSEIAQSFQVTQNDFGLSADQVQRLADNVKPGGSAMLALYEHLWAIPLKEAIIDAGGEVIASGIVNPDAMAVGGATLEDALEAALRIEMDAEQEAAAVLAGAQAIESTAEQEAAAKLAEAERILDEARRIAAMNIAASVRVAAEELDEADMILEEAEQEATVEVALGAEIAAAEIEAGAEIAAAEIAAGKAAAEEMIDEADQIAAAEVALGAGLAAAEVAAGAEIADEIVDDAERKAADIVTGAKIAGDEIVAGAEMASEDDEEEKED